MSASIRPRAIAAPTNAIARAWAAAALLSLLLPATARRGMWLPVHLFAAGAVSTAIVGNAQVLARGLAAAPDPSRRSIIAQLGAVNVGALLVAIGVPGGSTALAAIGGISFVAGLLLFAGGLARSWRDARNRRHGAAFLLYGAAVASAITGVILGAMLATGQVETVDAWIALRRAHIVVNVLGWATLPIVATMATMFPAALRTRAPGTPPWVAPMLLGGVGSTAAGSALAWSPGAVAGSVAWTVATLAVLVRSGKTFVGGSGGRPFGPGLHLGAAMLWLAATSIAFTVALARDTAAVDGFHDLFLIGFLAGCVGQALAGAWLLLVPMHRQDAPVARRRLTAIQDRGAVGVFIVFNAGLLVLALSRIGWMSSSLGSAGGYAAAGAAAAVLVRMWLAPRLVGRDAARGSPADG